MRGETDRPLSYARSSGIPPAAFLRVGEICLDTQSYLVTRGAREIRLGPTEFRLLAFMMQNPGRVLSREELRVAAWPDGKAIHARTVDVYAGRLRKALNRGRDRDPIRTVRYAGYVFALPSGKNKG
jgi:two-component system, OmpR family, phosphate regulon response regulator PhoB